MAPILTSLASIIKQYGITALAAGSDAGGGVEGTAITATGGVISNYEVSGTFYRAHIFTSTGTFNVTAADPGDVVDYLVIGGGAGGGGGHSGGGGAGGYRTSLPEGPGGPSPTAESQLEVTVSPYTITVGAGGAGSYGPSPGVGNPGTFSNFAHPSPVRSEGGGGGGNLNPGVGQNGGSGGGAGVDPARTPGTGGVGNRVANAATPAPNQGHPGGDVGSYGVPYFGGGGGGAGSAGGVGAPTGWGVGGSGKSSTITGSSVTRAGGGGGGGNNNFGSAPPSPPNGGPGGGGEGVKTGPGGYPATFSTGSGGGGGPWDGGYKGGNGASGIVVVRYAIPSAAGTAKATGGAISFYGGKTIHTFTSSGTFATAPNWTSATVEYVVVGGGGGGASNYGGGGGAGGYRTGTTPIGAHPVSTTIQVGAGGLKSNTNVLNANGTPSYFGTPITAAGGGAGAPDGLGGPGSGADAGRAGGSGGGHGLDGPGTVAAGNTPPTSPPQGNPGGTGSRSTNFGGGGGGGAGGAGQASTSGAAGGIGIQIPSTFLNPQSLIGTPGPNPGQGYVAGGGRGGINNLTGSSRGVGGGGYQESPVSAGEGTPGLENTGAGGGGQYQGNGNAGNGGSGIVILAYPT